MRVVSLFSGCGGLDLGFEGGFEFLGRHYKRNPFEIVFANDNHLPVCDTYDANSKLRITRGNIEEILKNEPSIIPDCDVVIGGFPCQDFSISGKRELFKNKRGQLYKEMIKVINIKNPSAFVAENVYGMVLLGALETIERDFSNAGIGYNVIHYSINAANYGVPQNRNRVFIIGIRKDIKTEFKKPRQTHPSNAKGKQNPPLTVKYAINDLLGKEESVPNHNEYSKARFYEKRWQGTSIIKSNEPAPTIRAHHHGNIQFHYNGHRRLTIRECARIQSFPDNFKFKSSTNQNYRIVGNSVPPVLAWHFARGLVTALKNGGFYEKRSENNVKNHVKNSLKKYKTGIVNAKGIKKSGAYAKATFQNNR